MRDLLLHWSWLVCLLVAVEVPIFFLDDNRKAPLAIRMMLRPRTWEWLNGLIALGTVTIVLIYILLLIFAGWKAAVFVVVTNMVAIALAEVVIPYCLPFGQADYSLIIAPVLWTILSSVLFFVRR